MRRSPLALAALLATAAGCADVPVPSAPDLTPASSTLAPATVLADKASTGRRGWHPILIEYAVSANVVDRYEFSAREEDDGTVSGTFRLRQLRYDPLHPRRSAVTVRARGRVVCIESIGNKARLGGVVTKSSFPEGIPVGSTFVWSVTDNGPSGWSSDDTASPLLGGVDPFGYCANGEAFDELPVVFGNILVSDDDET